MKLACRVARHSSPGLACLRSELVTLEVFMPAPGPNERPTSQPSITGVLGGPWTPGWGYCRCFLGFPRGDPRLGSWIPRAIAQTPRYPLAIRPMGERPSRACTRGARGKPPQVAPLASAPGYFGGPWSADLWGRAGPTGSLGGGPLERQAFILVALRGIREGSFAARRLV